MTDKLLKDMLEDQARVHDINKEQGIDCDGLPYCVSCRTVVLLQNDCDIIKTEQIINHSARGKVVRL